MAGAAGARLDLMEESISFQRLLELAQRADRIGRCGFTPFLTPPEAELAQAAARRCGVEAELFGGYEDAERRMARFLPAMTEEEPFPMTALEITWPHQDAPAHRDLLGAVMGLGVKRQCVGDIVLLPGKAYLFAESAMAAHLQSSLLEAGRVRLAVRLTDELPALEPPKGVEIRGTVQSVRLDA
ncbi:MAG: YlmH/Sll1252 family protein, partial [Eubacteriales bacterium]|nr:YlmH/Sll1252 family protein [Eubacteriales bacterium]